MLLASVRIFAAPSKHLPYRWIWSHGFLHNLEAAPALLIRSHFHISRRTISSSFPLCWYLFLTLPFPTFQKSSRHGSALSAAAVVDPGDSCLFFTHAVWTEASWARDGVAMVARAMVVVVAHFIVVVGLCDAIAGNVWWWSTGDAVVVQRTPPPPGKQVRLICCTSVFVLLFSWNRFSPPFYI